jgi:hypothetical protein
MRLTEREQKVPMGERTAKQWEKEIGFDVVMKY